MTTAAPTTTEPRTLCPEFISLVRIAYLGNPFRSHHFQHMIPDLGNPARVLFYCVHGCVLGFCCIGALRQPSLFPDLDSLKVQDLWHNTSTTEEIVVPDSAVPRLTSMALRLGERRLNEAFALCLPGVNVREDRFGSAFSSAQILRSNVSPKLIGALWEMCAESV